MAFSSGYLLFLGRSAAAATARQAFGESYFRFLPYFYRYLFTCHGSGRWRSKTALIPKEIQLLISSHSF